MSAMSIHLAPAALERIQGFLSADDSAIGLRFGVQRTGCSGWGYLADLAREQRDGDTVFEQDGVRSEEHTSELQSLMRISYAVFCLTKKMTQPHHHTTTSQIK